MCLPWRQQDFSPAKLGTSISILKLQTNLNNNYLNVTWQGVTLWDLLAKCQTIIFTMNSSDELPWLPANFISSWWWMQRSIFNNFSIRWNNLSIWIFIQAFRSIRSILVSRVEKSKDSNRSGEVLSTFDLGGLSSFLTFITPVKSLRMQLLTQGTSTFLSFDTQRSLTIAKVAL